MRVVFLIFMVLSFLVGGTTSGLLKVNIDKRTEGLDYAAVEKAKQQIEELKKQGIDVEKIQDAEVQNSLEMIKKAPQKWQADTASILGMVIALCALVMVVFAFMKKELVTKLAMGVAALSVALWLIAPDIEATMTSGVSPKSMAMVSMIALIICSACAFMSYKTYLKKAATV